MYHRRKMVNQKALHTHRVNNILNMPSPEIARLQPEPQRELPKEIEVTDDQIIEEQPDLEGAHHRLEALLAQRQTLDIEIENATAAVQEAEQAAIKAQETAIEKGWYVDPNSPEATQRLLEKTGEAQLTQKDVDAMRKDELNIN